jgi:hypothetical protein
MNGDGNLLGGIRDGEWLGRQDFPALRYAVPGIVPEGLTVLAGAPKVGKSWMVLDWLLAVAADDGRALGAITMPGAHDVLYLALEDGDRRMQDRCRRLLSSQWRPDEPIPPRFQYLTTVTPGLLIATIAAWLEIYQSGLVVVDTLGRALPPAANGETPYSRDYRIMSELKAVADEWPGSSLLLSHHDRKAISADFVDSVSGTNGIAGGADTVLLLTRGRGESDGLLQVTGRDVTEAAYAVSFDGGTWALDGADLAGAAAAARSRLASAGLADRSHDVVEFVGGKPGGVTAGDAAAALGLDVNTASAYLSRLTSAGRITRIRRGVYGAVGSVGVPEEPNGSNTSNTGTGGASGDQAAAHDASRRLRLGDSPDPGGE